MAIWEKKDMPKDEMKLGHRAETGRTKFLIPVRTAGKKDIRYVRK